MVDDDKADKYDKCIIYPYNIQNSLSKPTHSNYQNKYCCMVYQNISFKKNQDYFSHVDHGIKVI